MINQIKKIVKNNADIKRELEKETIILGYKFSLDVIKQMEQLIINGSYKDAKKNENWIKAFEYYNLKLRKAKGMTLVVMGCIPCWYQILQYLKMNDENIL